MWAKKQELVTEEDKESSSKKGVMYDVMEESAMNVLPTAPLEDLPRSQCSLLQPGECSSSQGDSPPREPENSDRYPVCNSAFGRQRRLEI